MLFFSHQIIFTTDYRRPIERNVHIKTTGTAYNVSILSSMEGCHLYIYTMIIYIADFIDKESELVATIPNKKTVEGQEEKLQQGV